MTLVAKVAGPLARRALLWAEPSPPYQRTPSRPVTVRAAVKMSATSSNPARYTATLSGPALPTAAWTCVLRSASAALKSVVLGSYRTPPVTVAPDAVAAARTESARPLLPRSLRHIGTMVVAPFFSMRSTLARPSTRSVGTKRKTLSSVSPSDDAVLPCEATSTPRASACSPMAATSELDWGPITIRTPLSANRVSAACACSASRFVFSTSSTTLTCLPCRDEFQRCAAISSAALLVVPRVAPSPVSESSAPMWTSRAPCAAPADGAATPTDPTTTSIATVACRHRCVDLITRIPAPLAAKAEIYTPSRATPVRRRTDSA